MGQLRLDDNLYDMEDAQYCLISDRIQQFCCNHATNLGFLCLAFALSTDCQDKFLKIAGLANLGDNLWPINTTSFTVLQRQLPFSLHWLGWTGRATAVCIWRRWRSSLLSSSWSRSGVLFGSRIRFSFLLSLPAFPLELLIVALHILLVIACNCGDRVLYCISKGVGSLIEGFHHSINARLGLLKPAAHGTRLPPRVSWWSCAPIAKTLNAILEGLGLLRIRGPSCRHDIGGSSYDYQMCFDP
mmetsp:Transcript_23749/g.55346  ORF Transcript_23749/g.55346 Transcript_23749/m.55346 type:complete len:243 (+) Transcript_23749:1140-1868(+)